ncbi:MAG TPA: TonB-dependent receptor [Allosphingosinicella sp.]
MTSKLVTTSGRAKAASFLGSASALAVALAAMPAVASAQEQAPPAEQQAVADPQAPEGNGVAQPEDAAQQDGDILVTGYRASIAASLDDKREANGIIDVIRAEDIADFPDNNLAESIQRIPGVAITRDQGEGRQITVRGLGPLFTRVRINGMEGLSTTGGADSSGGANRSRQFDFNIFASDLFNSITVRKSATADVEEGSLGATVDLLTARPFDYRDDFVFAASTQIGYNDLSGQSDPRVSALLSTRFADGRIGVLVSAAYGQRSIVEEGPSTVRWERNTDNGGFAAASTLPTGATAGTPYFHPRIPRYDSYRYQTERLGLTGSLQFQVTDRTLLTFDALYARFESQRQEQYLEAISFSRSGTGKPQTVILPGAVVDGTRSLVSGTFNNVDVRVESRFDELTTEFQQYTASLSHDFGGGLKVNLFGGQSRSKFENPIQTTVALDALNVQGYRYDFTQGRLPIFSYGNLDVSNPNSFVLGEIRLRPQFVDNEFTVARGEVSYELSPRLTFRTGIDYKQYGFDSRELRRASETAVPTLAAGQLASLSTTWFIDSGTPLPAGTPRAFVVPNLDAFASSLGIYSNSGTYALTGIENANARGNFRTIQEEDLGAYGQLDFNFPVGSITVRGNVGGRYVRTSQSSSGYTNQGTTPVLVTVDRDYEHFLPSFNIAADFDNGLIVRAAAAKVIARPDIGTLNPGGAFTISGGNRTFNRGNPFLSPTEATTLDLSFEYYFTRESALIVGLFHKDISTFVANTTDQIPFNQLGLPESLIRDQNGNLIIQPTDLITVNQPVNSQGGELKGIEVGLQTTFTFLPAPFDRLGIQANYTYVQSDIEYPLSPAAGSRTVTAPLVNLSSDAANLTLYYEDEVLSARVSAAYRSGYLQQVPGRNGPAATDPTAGTPTYNDVEGVNSSLNIDASVSLAITPQFSLTFEGVNLTDEYNDQYIDSAADRLSVYHHTGRQFYLGARFRF